MNFNTLSKNIEIKALAGEINKFTYDLCPYAYQDNLDDMSQSVEEFIKDIETMILENNQSLIDQLNQSVEYGNDEEEVTTAQSFIDRINKINKQ